MDAAQTEKLKALALAATPGEWKNYHGLIEDEMAGFGIATVRAYFAENEAIQAANAAYIAASCPATVLALIAEVERLRADAERFQKAIMFEDNAEALYAAVLNHAPDGAAIREEFDAAIAASKEKA